MKPACLIVVSGGLRENEMKLLQTKERNRHVAGWCRHGRAVPEDRPVGSAAAGQGFSPGAAARAFSLLAVLSASVAVLTAIPAQAGQPVAGAIIGGGAGALIGQAIGGRDGAIAGAAIGAAAGAASASRAGVYGSSVHVGAGVGYAPPAAVIYPVPVYGPPYGAVYGPVPPLYAPVAPVIVAPPLQYRPPVVFVSPTVVAPVVVPRAPTIVYRSPRVIQTRPPQQVYRVGNRMSHAGPAGAHRGHGHNGRRH